MREVNWTDAAQNVSARPPESLQLTRLTGFACDGGAVDRVALADRAAPSRLNVPVTAAAINRVRSSPSGRRVR